jgi:competence protein ComEA
MNPKLSLLLKVGLLGGVLPLILFMGSRSQDSSSPSLLVEAAEEAPSPPAPAANPPTVVQATTAVTSLRPHVKAASLGRSPVDPNRATLEDLQTLPGIGPVLARRVVERRTLHGPFHRLEDLLEVKGIGKKRLDRLRPFVILETGGAGKAMPTPASAGLTGASRD